MGTPEDDALMVSVAVRVADPSVAVMVALPEALAPAVILKLPEVWPAGIETEAGTVTCALLLTSDTVAPFEPAAPLSDTLQMMVAPGAIVPAEQVTAEREAAGWTVSTAVCVTPADVAEIVTLCELVTTVVATVKVALVRPAGTVTWLWGVASELLVESVTGVPPDGAADARFTVQVAFVPPVTLLGLQVTEETAG